MYEHSTAIENLRQVTLTTDPDTENEETFSVQVPKGDGVVIYLPEGYDGIYRPGLYQGRRIPYRPQCRRYIIYGKGKVEDAKYKRLIN